MSDIHSYIRKSAKLRDEHDLMMYLNLDGPPSYITVSKEPVIEQGDTFNLDFGSSLYSTDFEYQPFSASPHHAVGTYAPQLPPLPVEYHRRRRSPTPANSITAGSEVSSSTALPSVPSRTVTSGGDARRTSTGRFASKETQNPLKLNVANSPSQNAGLFSQGWPKWSVEDRSQPLEPQDIIRRESFPKSAERDIQRHGTQEAMSRETMAFNEQLQALERDFSERRTKRKAEVGVSRQSTLSIPTSPPQMLDRRVQRQG